MRSMHSAVNKPLVWMVILMGCYGPAVKAGEILESVWRGTGSTRNAAGPLTILSWNIERGLNLPGIEAVLEQHAPHVALLQEVDLNARRTGRKNIAADLARRFHMHWAFAVEFEELGQGDSSSPAYVGQAVLSYLPIRSARILRFKEQSGFWQPRWFIPDWGIFQRRRGGRMALIAELASKEGPLIVYDTHLESQGSEKRRLRQVEEIIADAAKHASTAPVVIAGDFNTRRRPSPVISRLQEAGFRQAAGSEKSTSARGAALDWIFVRGPLTFREGSVLSDVKASDHYPLKVRLSIKR